MSMTYFFLYVNNIRRVNNISWSDYKSLYQMKHACQTDKKWSQKNSP